MVENPDVLENSRIADFKNSFSRNSKMCRGSRSSLSINQLSCIVSSFHIEHIERWTVVSGKFNVLDCSRHLVWTEGTAVKIHALNPISWSPPKIRIGSICQVPFILLYRPRKNTGVILHKINSARSWSSSWGICLGGNSKRSSRGRDNPIAHKFF